MSEESVNSRRCKGGNLFFSRILFCICLCGPVAYALAEESTVVSEIRQNEKKSISGVVTDTNDEPLIGATVLVKGTQNGTVTDVDGRFHLKVNSGETLVVSYIGMKSKEVAVVDGKKELFIRLDADTEMLDEVLVTGYQTLSKERSTGAFSKVSTEKLELKRMDNLSSMLEGQVAGYVNGQIRGVTTMNAVANPMVVIDGFPVENTTLDRIGQTTENMPDLNPEDIESVTVLKDAAAASIYGARAANGVIVITTKKAKEGKAEVSFSSTFTVHPYSYYKKNRTNAADVIAMEREWATMALSTPEAAEMQAADLRENGPYPSLGVNTLLDMYTGKISMAEGDKILNQLASYGYQYYDQAEKYGKRNPFYQQYNLRVGKTTERNSFNFSTTYWDNDYEDINHSDWKLGINITNSLQLTNWLHFDTGVYLKYGKEKNQSYDLFDPGFSVMPYDPLVNADGSYFVAPSQSDKSRRDLVDQYGLYSEDLVPMDELNYALNTTKTFETRAYAKLKFDLTSWLNYNVMFQYETSDSDYESLGEKESNFMRKRINDFTSKSPNGSSLVYNLPNGDSFHTLKNSKHSYNFRQQLSLDKTFDEKHNLVWILGQEVRHSLINFDENTVYGYDPELKTWQNYNMKDLAYFSGLLGSAQLDQNSIASSRELLNRFVSFYSNASYTYDDKYVLSGSIRWDRSNLWGTNSKYQNKPLWSVGGSWNIYKEKFFQADFVDMLKLRASYGIGGNIGRNTAPYLIASYYDSSLVDGMAGSVNTPPNKDIRWEKTTTVNVGVDFALFRHRLSGTIEYYNKYSVDLLAAINGSPTQGFGYTTLMTNNGKMVNRGVEITLSGEIIRQKDFSWNASLLDQNSIASSRELLNRFVSFYSNASYTYDDKYVLSGSIRWDRSNLWGTNSKYQNKPLWSVGGSWNIYKEKFFQADFVDMLKLRASYGIGGNIGRNTAPYLIASYYDSSLVDGMAGSVNTPPNKDIRWEKTTTVNVGVDFALFRHRLSGTIEYYNKYSVDLLAAINGSPTQGFGYTTLMTNNGKMVNRGVEITLSGEIIRQKDFSWNASLLYAFNRNKVKHISVQPSLWDSRISMPTSYPMVGKPLYGIYAYKWAGLNENGDPQVYDAENNVTSGPARDYHALVYCGTTVPIHNASLTNVLRYKGFEFSAMLILDAGHKLRSSNIPSINMSNGRITSTAKGIVDRWTQPGDVTDVPRLLFSNDTENFNTHRTELYRYSDLFVYDASNIRLSNISLAYRVPAHWCKKISLSGARLQFNVENVATFAFDSKANYDLGGKVKPNYVWGLYLNF